GPQACARRKARPAQVHATASTPATLHQSCAAVPASLDRFAPAPLRKRPAPRTAPPVRPVQSSAAPASALGRVLARRAHRDGRSFSASLLPHIESTAPNANTCAFSRP